ncbi:MAG TPA: hypothetical protein DEP61_04640 [Lachnospiraceae bacterium]|nr:hypothetical protein [Lachnospiraceae bacterium]
MQNRLQAENLPEAIEKLLQNQECLSYLVFVSGDCFQVREIYSPDSKRILYGLQREYSRLGRSLVDAIWFHHPAKLLLVCGQELFWSEVDVYKCHIAGPLFTDNLLRIRKKNPGGDIASSWEFRTGEWKKANRTSFQKETANAMSETEGSFLEEVHLDRKLRDTTHPVFR